MLSLKIVSVFSITFIFVIILTSINNTNNYCNSIIATDKITITKK
jgi:hypothetical protein